MAVKGTGEGVDTRDDFLKEYFRPTVLKGCGMDIDEINRLENNMKSLANMILNR